ncbi:class F sortase [Saccharomonospora cyanea]|uniref:Sortase (Surface protein transpeptidase) n=1 Tax=Saccharomonospora cyanea NA-134 TaxID=882082 RepID=H5XGI0_9PSEU|nr:class F sortase [Saccharomonospora cyanea]EHR60519.1 sortase (surface protein transpeptidase) [Saccharomonospora cyanea NA-134]
MTSWWRSPVWQRRTATALGVLAVLAVTAGTAVLRSAPSARPSEPGAVAPAPAVPEVTARVPGTAETEPPREPRAAPPRPGPQPPNSVRLPGGATSTLVRTELTADGTLPIPGGVDRAAWWGAGFGDDRGAALVAGHVDWYGRSGPFTSLFRLEAGDEVTVRDAAGRTWTYRVASATTLHKSRLARYAPELFAQDGPHRLLLVTCGGDYLGGTGGYSDNHIVTAKLVSGR